MVLLATAANSIIMSAKTQSDLWHAHVLTQPVKQMPVAALDAIYPFLLK